MPRVLRDLADVLCTQAAEPGASQPAQRSEGNKTQVGFTECALSEPLSEKAA
jgi:hypothetical protein